MSLRNELTKLGFYDYGLDGYHPGMLSSSKRLYVSFTTPITMVEVDGDPEGCVVSFNNLGKVRSHTKALDFVNKYLVKETMQS